MSIATESTQDVMAALPEPLVAVLRQVIRRRRIVILVRGLLTVAAVAIFALLSVMAIDATVSLFLPIARWLLTGSALGLVVLAVVWFLVRPLARRMTMAHIAQIVDAHHPEFEERVSSTVELLLERNGRSSMASPAMLRELTSQALDQVRAVQPRSEFSLRSARPYLVAACVAGTILGAIWLAWPERTSRLIQRALTPHIDMGTFGSEALAVEPGDTMIALGDPLRIAVTVHDHIAQTARVLVTDAANNETTRAMTRTSAPDTDSAEFAVTLPPVESELRYRVIVDRKTRSPSFRVQVTPRPDVASYDLRYEFPAYTGMTAMTVKGAAGDIVAPIGTLVTLSATFNKPLTEAKLLINDEAHLPDRVDDADGLVAATWRIGVGEEIAGKWSLELKDEYDLETHTTEHAIQIIPDRAPMVAIADPAATEIRVRPTDTLPLIYHVREDYGIAEARLVLELAPDHSESFTTNLPQRSTIEEGTWIGQTTLDLRTLPLAGVQRIEVRIEVRDTLPELIGGPHVATSKPLVLVFDVNAPRFASQSTEKTANEIAARLNEAINLLRGAKGQVAAILPTLSEQPLRLENASRNAVSSAHNSTGKAEAILLQVEDDHVRTEYSHIVVQAGAVADAYVSPARQLLELLPLANAKAEQVAEAMSADLKIDAAITYLEALRADLEIERDYAARARELAAEAGSLGDRQARIREATENAIKPMAKEDPAEQVARQIAEAQWQIAADTVELGNKVEAQGLKQVSEHHQAAESTRQAAKDLFDRKLESAAVAGKKAAEQLGQLAAKLKDNPPASPAQDPLAAPLDKQAAQLAERQKNVNEQLAALERGDLAAALESLQKDLAQRAKDLAERTEKLSELAEQKGSPQKSEDAKGAADALGQAAEKAMEAAEALAHIDNIPKFSPLKFITGPMSPSDNGGNPDGGQGTKGGGSNTGAGSSKKPSPSNNNVNKTMGAGKRLGKATLTAEALLNQKPSNDNQPSGGSGTELQADAEELLRKGLATLMADDNPLAKGFGGFGGSAPDVPVPPSPPKEFSAQSTSPPSNKPGPPGSPSGGKPGGTQPSGSGAALGAGPGNVAGRLGALGISGDDWLRLPSDLRTQILKAADDRAPREYRELVRRYFQTISRRGGQQRGAEK